MFCPQCGSTQAVNLNFCKSCGANLGSVRNALEKPGTDEEFNWKGTWLAEAVMTRAEKDRLRGVTPEMKRKREIKAGIITLSAGIGGTLVVATIMEGIIAGGAVSAVAIAILSRLWIVGLIPIFVGAALIINGVFISKKGDEIGYTVPLTEQPDNVLPSTTTNELGPAVPFSVTDETTRHLERVPTAKTPADFPSEK